MDIRGKRWHPLALEATAPELLKKLPSLNPSSHVLGNVSGYFAGKYGLNPNALALTWTGDNPASLLGLRLIKEGIVGISTGTSLPILEPCGNAMSIEQARGISLSVRQETTCP